jgi:hypothetical protein
MSSNNWQKATKIWRATSWLRFFCSLLRDRKKLNLNPNNLYSIIHTASIRKNISSNDLSFRLNFAETFQTFLLEYNSNYHLIRMGRDGDGGYSIPPLKFERLIGIGVGKDISFESDDYFEHSEIHLFDHTVQWPTNLKKNMKFHKKGIGLSDTADLLSFDSICDLSGIKASTSNLLKFDIEGDEIFVFAEADFSPFSTIVCELHWIEDAFYSDRFPNFQKLFENLTRNHSLINVHANNWSHLFNFGNIVLPNVVELTLINMKNTKEARKTSTRNNLDFPCRPNYPEIWPFKSEEF